MTLSHFQSASLKVDRKLDGTQVTTADRAAEMLLRERILARFPLNGVLGEEFGEAIGTSGMHWILDPIDGTASFVCGVPLFSNLVAMELQGRAIIGVIHLPALNETVYAARGLGAWHVASFLPPRAARVSRVSDLREAVVCLHDFPRLFCTCPTNRAIRHDPPSGHSSGDGATPMPRFCSPRVA